MRTLKRSVAQIPLSVCLGKHALKFFSLCRSLPADSNCQFCSVGYTMFMRSGTTYTPSETGVSGETAAKVLTYTAYQRVTRVCMPVNGVTVSRSHAGLNCQSSGFPAYLKALDKLLKTHISIKKNQKLNM